MASMPVDGVQPATGAADPADLVIRNAAMPTGDPARPVASAAAVRAGVFTAVGDDATVADQIGPDTQVVDAPGWRVVPGLNDSHLHVIRGGCNYLPELRWDGVPSLAMGLAMLAEQAQRTAPGQWIRVVGGWSAEQMAEQRLPTVAELNTAAPDVPVFVMHLYQAASSTCGCIGLTRCWDACDGGPLLIPAANHRARP